MDMAMADAAMVVMADTVDMADTEVMAEEVTVDMEDAVMAVTEDEVMASMDRKRKNSVVQLFSLNKTQV